MSATLKILLINPPCRRAVEVPLGLGYIASALRLAGHKVAILDINGSGLSQDRVIYAVKNMDFDLAGIGGLTPTYKYVKWLSSVIKKIKPRVPIVAGNMVSTAIPELLLKNTDVDIAVIDEGEETCKELAKMLWEEKNLEEVDGIMFKRDSQIWRTRPRKRIENLDSLPFPAWDLFPIETYLKGAIHFDYGLRNMSMSTVRGCPYGCIYCSRPFGRKVYARSAKSMIDEIKELKKRYRVEYIGFADDLFLFNEERNLEFCDNMVKEGLDVKWGGSGRVNLVNEKLLTRMKKSGCICLAYGFESGSQKLLDIMQKNVTVKQAEEAIKMTRKCGIKVMGSFMFGLPGETPDTINETLGFIKKTRLPIYRFFYATPYPNTKLYEIAKKMGRLPENDDKYIEGLGEMRTTFLVNLTDFSDSELVRLKELAEQRVRSNLGFNLWARELIEGWQRRLVVIRQTLKNSGVAATAKSVFLKALQIIKKKGMK